MSPRRLGLLGAGGHGHVIADAASESGSWTDIVFFDDAPLTGIVAAFPKRWTLGGTFSDCLSDSSLCDGYVVGVGDSRVRMRVLDALAHASFQLVSIVHPSAVVSPFATVGAGGIVCASAVVGFRASLGLGVIVNTGASVDHDCRLGHGVHVSPGAHLTGSVIVEDGAWIGVGVCVVPGVRIGAGSIIGAGSTVLDDVPAHVVAVGSPAKVVRTLTSDLDGAA